MIRCILNILVICNNSRKQHNTGAAAQPGPPAISQACPARRAAAPQSADRKKSKPENETAPEPPGKTFSVFLPVRTRRNDTTVP